MTANVHSTTDEEQSDDRGLDPEALAAREDVAYAERSVRHPDEDHCEADAEGRAIVGVTTDDGEVLLLADPDTPPYVVLPNRIVDPGEDWVDVARDAAEELVDAPVAVGDAVAVRRVEHGVEDSDAIHNVSHHVVFGASVDGPADPVAPEDVDWNVDWVDALPDWVDAEEGDALADVRRFLDA